MNLFHLSYSQKSALWYGLTTFVATSVVTLLPTLNDLLGNVHNHTVADILAAALVAASVWAKHRLITPQANASAQDPTPAS